MLMDNFQKHEHRTLEIQDILKSAFSNWGEPPLSTIAALAAAAKQVNFSKNSIIVQQGSFDDNLYLVQQGLWRIYYTTDNGREFIKAFIKDNMFFAALSSFIRQKPVAFSIQALEDSTVIRIPYKVFSDLLQTDPRLLTVWCRYMESHFTRHEDRERMLLIASGIERYHHFLKTHASLEKRIPQYHIASYLGLTEQSLSRIKAGLELSVLDSCPSI